MECIQKPVRGRGALENPTGRFEPFTRLEWLEEAAEPGRVKTQLFKDSARSIIAFNDSPDVGFSATLNPYRGCEHGCIYCYARPTHEYFGLSAGLDFETKLFVKLDAPALLRKKLASPGWVPQTVGLSGVTDAYQPIERRLKLTRGCLEVLAEFRNPVGIVTKNHLVTRDIDLLAGLVAENAARVFISITTLDSELARLLEPRASAPRLRLKAVRELTAAGIPVGVMMAPLIPGLTDEEIPALLQAAADAGAVTAYYTMLRLPYGVAQLFEHWLEAHRPLRKDKILNRIREMRSGKLNIATFGDRMRGDGEYAKSIDALFKLSRRRAGLDRPLEPLSAAAFRRAQPRQLSLL